MPNNSIAYIEKTMPKVLDKVMAKESMTDSLIGGSEIKLDFDGAKKVKITKLATTGLTNYNRGGHGNANTEGAVQSTHEEFEMKQERFSSIPLDKLDTLDDGETVLGHMATEFIRTKVVPEFDTYRFSKLASYTSATLGNRVTVTSANLANHIVDEFNKALKWMSENQVEEKDMIMYVSPEAMYLIRSTTELYKKLSQSEYAGKVSFAIQNYENKPIVEVPSNRFYTDCNISANGYGPKATSKKIHFMIVSKKAPIVVKKLAWTKTYDSDNCDIGFVGYKFNNLYYHDIFVTDNMVPCIYACVSDESANGAANALLVDAVEGASSGKTVLRRALTQPGGILFDAIGLYSTNGTAPDVGATFSDKSVAEIADGEVTYKDFTPATGVEGATPHNILVATLAGKVVAVTKDFTNTLPTKSA